MYNTRHLPADEILCAFGDTDNFRLEQLIEPEFSEEEINILKPSEYYSIETLPIQLKNLNNFNKLSLNAQSINAKFDCLLALIEVAKHQGITFHILIFLYTTISDHYPYFLSLNRSKNRGNKPPSRYVRQRVNTESGPNAFLAELMNSDITSQLNPDPYCDPKINYDILHKHLTELKDKHLPYRLVKFNKYKHKGNKWITNGVLKLLKYKDRLYK